jgi:hypothetical protein
MAVETPHNFQFYDDFLGCARKIIGNVIFFGLFLSPV